MSFFLRRALCVLCPNPLRTLILGHVIQESEAGIRSVAVDVTASTPSTGWSQALTFLINIMEALRSEKKNTLPFCGLTELTVVVKV